MHMLPLWRAHCLAKVLKIMQTHDLSEDDDLSPMAGKAAGLGDSAHAPLLWSCADEAVLRLIRRRDPSGRGLPGARALRLLMALLHWNPSARPTPDEARRPPHLSLHLLTYSHAHIPGASFRYMHVYRVIATSITVLLQALRHAFFTEPAEERGAQQGSAACSDDRSRVGWC